MLGIKGGFGASLSVCLSVHMSIVCVCVCVCVGVCVGVCGGGGGGGGGDVCVPYTCVCSNHPVVLTHTLTQFESAFYYRSSLVSSL